MYSRVYKKNVPVQVVNRRKLNEGTVLASGYRFTVPVSGGTYGGISLASGYRLYLTSNTSEEGGVLTA